MDSIPLEMACRAICSMETLGYPKTASGQARAQAYIDEHWLGVWAWMRIKANWRAVWGGLQS